MSILNYRRFFRRFGTHASILYFYIKLGVKCLCFLSKELYRAQFGDCGRFSIICLCSYYHYGLAAALAMMLQSDFQVIHYFPSHALNLI